MERKQDFTFITYILLISISLLIAKFIFSDGLNVLYHSFKPLLLASIFIYLLAPLANALYTNTKLSRKSSVVITYIACLLVIALFVSLIIPGIINSTRLLVLNISQYEDKEIVNFIQQIPIISNYVNTSSISSMVESLENYIVDYSANILKYSTNVINSIGSVFYNIIILLIAAFMSFYALKDTENISKNLTEFVVVFFPKNVANTIIRIAKLTDQSIKKYLIGKLYTCLILGILVSLSIVLVNTFIPSLNIPYAPLIGLIIGLTNIIPYIGGLLGTVPCIIIALFSGFWEAVALLIIVTVMQQVDNIFVGPKIIGDTMHLKPFWVIVGISIGGSLFGIIGMIIAAPIISVILQLFDEKINKYKASNKKPNNNVSS